MQYKKSGTDESGLIKACEQFGFEYEIISVKRKYKGDVLYKKLKIELALKSKVIVSVDNFSHWVLIAGKRQDSLTLIDPSRSEQTIAYYTKEEFLNRWWGKEAKYIRPRYYAIIVKKQEKTF